MQLLVWAEGRKGSHTCPYFQLYINIIFSARDSGQLIKIIGGSLRVWVVGTGNSSSILHVVNTCAYLEGAPLYTLNGKISPYDNATVSEGGYQYNDQMFHSKQFLLH